ncbi:two-component system response regulator BtsR [Deferribacter autotrophicus]|uniref:Two-component system response regulator BtsR n=1 Tax=Deferribacter autotrophicus TaxID=500465 RepID=A0A5A8F3S6_9BACT|nr:two-component system response regulator BtsR [Deferribacter autotrophicus]KAA0257134.1 two-component system response regulator BtsR [Deferribacter autotrophicus]
MKLKAVIIDDEHYARQELKFLLDEFEEIEVIAECSNAFEGIKIINKFKPDIIFLDVQMPGIDGFDMLKLIDDEKIPYVVFVSAYDEYAIKAFEEDALDYVLKPVEKERLSKTIEKIRGALIQGSKPHYNMGKLSKIPCSIKNVIKLVDVDEIQYVKSDITGVHIVTEEREYFTDLTLKTIEQKTDLFRCHKQYLINLDKIDEILLQENGSAIIITHNKFRVSVSRRYFKVLKEVLGI